MPACPEPVTSQHLGKRPKHPLPMPIVCAERLSKTYRVAQKQPGLGGTLRHFFWRQSRAVDAVPTDMRTKPAEGADGTGAAERIVLANLYEGIFMTDAMLTKSFAANGIDKFGVVGEVFDPNLHECFFEYED